MPKTPEIEKPKSWLDSLNFCVEGVIYGFKTEKHIRYHFVLAVVALVASLVLKLPAFEFVIFALSVVFLIFAEMVNTAIEEVVNLVEDKYNIRAKNAKDISAGAVLIAAFGLLITVYFIFSKYIYGPVGEWLGMPGAAPIHLAFVSLLLVLIAVMALKALFGKGRPLHGGLPSGHAAVAFSLWVSVGFITREPLVIVLTLVIALLVSQSRLVGGIHTWVEVIIGSFVGALITFLVFVLYSFLTTVATP